jgi:hypothetical protein
MGWLTGSGIFNPVLHVQMQVQVLPIATATTLVCRYMVKYHGEWFDIACVQTVNTLENRNMNKEQS